MKNLFSPTMLKSYLSCKYIIFNEINEKRLKLKKIEISKNDQLRLDKGDEHEEKYFKILKKKFKKVIDIKNLKTSKEEKIVTTLQAMQEGYEIIYGGYLERDNWRGEFDFLQLNPKVKSKLGNFSYEVIDTKHTAKPKPDHIIQLGMYTYMLEGTQGVLPQKFTIVLKDFVTEHVQINHVNDYFKAHQSNYENFLKTGVDTIKPEKCGFCQVCKWKDECDKIWIAEDHLNQVGGLSRVHIKKLNKLKIKTLTDLAKKDRTKPLKGLRDEISYKLITQAQLQKQYQQTQKPIYEYNPDNIEGFKGFNLLPKPSDEDLYFDIESIEDHVYPGGLEYLFGIYYKEKGKSKFKALWSHTKEQEKKTVIDFFNFTKSHFKKYPNAKIYHYGSYEITALLKLTSFFKIKEIEYDNYLRQNKFVNLLNVNRQGIYISENSYSLKNMEIFYGFKREGDLRKGDVSQEYYSEWIETQNQQLLDDIESYNEQDCRSTYELHQWLLSIKPKESGWFNPYLQEEEETELKDWEVKMMAYQEKIEKSSLRKDQNKQLLADIIGFYYRENKPAWREFFERKTKSDEELMEDPECIGNMVLAGEPTPEKRSMIFQYQYEDQDFKLRKGKETTIANNQIYEQSDYAGKIVDIDYVKKEIFLKRGNTRGKLPPILSVGPKKPQDSDNLILNIYRFIDSLLNKEKKYKALNDFLSKKIPDIKGIKSGNQIIKSSNFIEEIPKIISNLQDSYIYIQGPPGTGKTYHASNAILELLKQNKKIAITGLSHKVIHNLLERLESLALENNFKFEGFKKGNFEDEDTVYTGSFIQTFEKDPPFMEALNKKNVGQVFAGTKFHFAKYYYEESIDYLFIDEAGQMSIADLISLGIIAKNIVLIGDQNQLGQPIKGTHPNNSGLSILDYLLSGKDTISNDRGIFLDTSYRLHPDINSFISSNFYEDRLLCDSQTKDRSIDFGKKSTIQGSGIHYLEMNHRNNAQTSVEEFEVVRNLMKELIGLTYHDNGYKRKLTIDDILVISPFNTQVNFLIAELEKENFKKPRVGTIDKFQGQEAPISIISMTTSDIELLPRNREFFFNRNRLNVAISRAKVASIILFNPNLLNSTPRSIEQIKLMNNFFKILKFKKFI